MFLRRDGRRLVCFHRDAVRRNRACPLLLRDHRSRLAGARYNHRDAAHQNRVCLLLRRDRRSHPDGARCNRRDAVRRNRLVCCPPDRCRDLWDGCPCARQFLRAAGERGRRRRSGYGNHLLHGEAGDLRDVPLPCLPPQRAAGYWGKRIPDDLRQERRCVPAGQTGLLWRKGPELYCFL
jgi:hypothetical protein